MGRSDRDPTSRRWNSGHFVVGSASDPGRDLFYSSASFSADPSVSGYDPRSDRWEIWLE